MQSLEHALERMLTTLQAAERLKVTRRAVLAAIERGALQAEKLPGRTGGYYIDVDELERYAKTRLGAA